MPFHRFKDLPMELRICVYKQLLQFGDIVVPENPARKMIITMHRHYLRGATPTTQAAIVDEEEDAAVSPAEVAAVTTGPKPSSFNIAFVSRSISEEFLQVAYSYGTFNIPLTRSFTGDWDIYRVSDGSLQQIRHIRFVRDCNTEKPWFTLESSRELDFRGFVKRCPCLGTIEVELVLREDMLKRMKNTKNQLGFVPPQFWAISHARRMTRNNVWDVHESDWADSWVI